MVTEVSTSQAYRKACLRGQKIPAALPPSASSVGFQGRDYHTHQSRLAVSKKLQIFRLQNPRMLG
jgi:hypothetical protein